jgi:hypothetical protein
MEVPFDSGNDEESAPKNGRQRFNDLLAPLVSADGLALSRLSTRPGSCFRKIERDDSRQHREEKPKSPRLKWRVQAGAKSITAMMI